MQIPGLAPTQPLSLQAGQPIRPGQWSVGQLLQATVSEPMAAGRLAPHAALLRIANLEVLAQTPIPLQPGTSLSLKVVQNGRQPILQIITPGDPRAEITNAAVRQALPRQGPLAPLLNNLLTVTGQSGNFEGQLPRGSINILQSILAGIPQLNSLRDAAGVQRAVAASGIFLEAKLAGLLDRSSEATASPDLKAGLLKLVSLTQAAASGAHRSPALPGLPAANLTGLQPGEDPARTLARQAEAGLARIALDQLTSIHPESSKAAVWTLDLPFQDGDQAFTARLQIARDQQQSAGSEAAARQWDISLEIDLPELGPMHARLTLQRGLLTTRLWAERGNTLELLRAHSEKLSRRLADSGFSSARVCVYPGQPDSVTAETGLPDLIDVKA